MAWDFTDRVYQGRSAEDFWLFYFLAFYRIEAGGNEACPGLGGLSLPRAGCSLTSLLLPVPIHCSFSLIFLNTIPNSSEPNSYTNVTSETRLCCENTEGSRDPELQQERGWRWSSQECFTQNWCHVLCHKLAFPKFSERRERAGCHWIDVQPQLFTIYKELTRGFLNLTRFKKCSLQFSPS